MEAYAITPPPVMGGIGVGVVVEMGAGVRVGDGRGVLVGDSLVGTDKGVSVGPDGVDGAMVSTLPQPAKKVDTHRTMMITLVCKDIVS